VGQPVALARPGLSRLSSRLPLALAALLPLGFLAVFFVWPVAAIIRLGLGRGSIWPVLSTSDTWGLVGFTVGQAAASTVLAVLAGLPVAYLLARCRLPGLWLVRVVVLVPFVLPTVVVGLAFRALFGDTGVLAIVLANAFFNVAVVARTVAGLWTHLDRRAEQAAATLGASPVRVFLTVVLPGLRPALASAAAVVFLFCATSFGVVLILGGARHRTLETEIYLRTVELLDLPGAAALSLLQLVAVLAALTVGAVARRRRESALRLRGLRQQPRRPAGLGLVAACAGLGVVAALLVPVVVLVLRSLSTSGGWGLDGFRALAGRGLPGTLAVSGVDAVLNSLRAATDATLIALLLGGVAAVVLVSLGRSAVRPALVETVDAAFMLPLGVSAVTVGFGYLVTLDALPGDLRTSALLVPLAQALVVTPLVVRILLPVLRSIDPRQRQAAAVLGASPVRVWWEVDARLAGRSVLTATAFGYVVALGEFGATSFLARPETITLPVAIGRLISRPGALNTQMAYAACVVLVVLTVAAVALIEAVRAPGGAPVGEF